MCVYIYIYIYILLVGAKDYTPEITKVKFHWKMPREIHWTIPIKTHWRSDNPLGNTTEK